VDGSWIQERFSLSCYSNLVGLFGRQKFRPVVKKVEGIWEHHDECKSAG
jgi:hypothetical protein